MDSRLIHLASGYVDGKRQSLELVLHVDESKDSHEAIRLSYRGFPHRHRGKWFHRRDRVDAERLFAIEAERLGMEVRW